MLDTPTPPAAQRRRSDGPAGPGGTAEAASLRVDVDRALVRTMAWLFPFLVLQSVPSFLAQRSPGAAWAPASLALAALPCLLVLPALRRPRAEPSPAWLLVAAGGYLPLLALEALDAAPALSVAHLPWLLAVAPPFIACFALGVRRPSAWAVGTLVAAAGMTAVYGSRLPLDRLTMTVFGLVTFSAGAFAGVRALRRRAGRAEAAQRDARDRYDESQRRIALEDERVRTDALLHDSLLNALLVAAAASAPRTRADAARSAEQAIRVLDGRSARPSPQAPPAGTETLSSALEHELAPLRELVRLDLAAAAVHVPHRVTEAVAAAALQALNNSIKHAGPEATRGVRAEPVGADGVRVTVHDDGPGFDPAAVAPERLGVRVSIVGRMAAIGGTATVRSAPGAGTVVVLAWAPAGRGLRDPLDAVRAVPA